MTNWRPRDLTPARMATVIVIGVALIALIVLIGLNLRTGAAPPTGKPLSVPTSPATLSPLEPTSSAGAQPTDSQPTDQPPTGSQTAPPTPAGSLTPEQALLTHVPQEIRASCTVEPGRGPVTLAARCTADDGALIVNYYAYASAEGMAGEYSELRDASQIEPSTGRCEDPDTWPAESEYRVGGQITGRRLCTDHPGALTIYWTDDRLNILGHAIDASAGVDRLIEFWTNESGPIP